MDLYELERSFGDGLVGHINYIALQDHQVSLAPVKMNLICELPFFTFDTKDANAAHACDPGCA